MLEICLGCLHQVGNEVIATFQLHVYLRKGVLEPVPQGHQAVVDAYNKQRENDYYRQNYD
jgi:hypothetical protein